MKAFNKTEMFIVLQLLISTFHANSYDCFSLLLKSFL